MRRGQVRGFMSEGSTPGSSTALPTCAGFKGSLYEGGIRIPALARLPGRIPAGVVSDALGYFADWFPTLCDAVGLPRPADLDGESLWPVLLGGRVPESRRPLVWVFPEYGGQVAVRLGAFKVLRRNLKTKSPGDWEVYDLSTDRGENRDLAKERGDLIRQAVEVFRRETDENPLFPVPIPGVNVPELVK